MPILRRLLPPGSRVVVATSGGPDSQSLLDLLGRAQAELELGALLACGIDHGLRPDAAAELELAHRLADKHGVTFICRRVTLATAGNMLENARRARYAALRELLQQQQADRLAVAHTANDQAETILLHLVRGCALRGAAAMPLRRGPLVRPLLEVPRRELLDYLRARQISYATDPSNAHPQRARARLRAHVMPGLESINAGAVRNLARFALRAQQDERHLVRRALELLDRAQGPADALDLAALAAAPRAVGLRALRTFLEQRGVHLEARGLEQLVRSRRRELTLRVAGTPLCLSRGCLWTGTALPYERLLQAGGRIEVPELGLALSGSILELAGEHDRAIETRSALQVAFDYDKVHLPLCVRSVRPGDRLQPFGSRGSTKVGDLFTNAKMPRPLRPRWPIVAVGDEVAWVVGLRRGRCAPVTPATRRVLLVQVEGALPWSA
jgi:tRNA(Ile)-lysidine synthase